MRHLALLTLAFALVLSSARLHAQYNEIGVAFGTANDAGDLSAGRYRGANVQPALGLCVQHNRGPRLAARASVTLAQLRGDDAHAGDARQIPRALSFRSPLAARRSPKWPRWASSTSRPTPPATTSAPRFT